MEHIKNLLTNPTTQESCEDLANVTQTNDKLLTRLFAVLSAQYGNRWTSLIQNEDAENAMRNVWGHTLMDVEPLVMKSVLDKLPQEYPNWPPTVGQFLELCKVGIDPAMRPSLPKPRGDEKIALDALAQMKKITGGR